MASALIDGGAGLEAPDDSMGTPARQCGRLHLLAWGASPRRARGQVGALWLAAGLGMMSRFEQLLGKSGANARDAVSQPFWHACSGGQRRGAELVLARGEDLNWTPAYAKGTPLDAARGQGTRQENVIGWLRSLKARCSEEPE